MMSEQLNVRNTASLLTTASATALAILTLAEAEIAQARTLLAHASLAVGDAENVADILNAGAHKAFMLSVRVLDDAIGGLLGAAAAPHIALDGLFGAAAQMLPEEKARLESLLHAHLLGSDIGEDTTAEFMSHVRKMRGVMTAAAPEEASAQGEAG